MLLTLELCHKSIGTYKRVVKNKEVRHRITVLSIFNYSVKKLPNLVSSFSKSDNNWKNKILIILAETLRIVRNLSRNFPQTQSFFIVLNQKQMLFVLGKTGSKEKKLLNFKRSSKTFTQHTKATWNDVYLL